MSFSSNFQLSAKQTLNTINKSSSVKKLASQENYRKKGAHLNSHKLTKKLRLTNISFGKHQSIRKFKQISTH